MVRPRPADGKLWAPQRPATMAPRYEIPRSESNQPSVERRNSGSVTIVPKKKALRSGSDVGKGEGVGGGCADVTE
ncbi:hypothetical protein ACOMHN_036410 [Nucella lapillus]